MLYVVTEVDALNKTNTLLFAEERLNLFIDDVTLFRWLIIALRKAPSKALPNTSRAILQLLGAIQSALQDAGCISSEAALEPLGIRSQASWWLVAYKVASLWPMLTIADEDKQRYQPLLETLCHISDVTMP